jgi:hypothetical protein
VKILLQREKPIPAGVRAQQDRRAHGWAKKLERAADECLRVAKARDRHLIHKCFLS